ncbi:VC0807 family protein [Heyndrickxia acidicola]|uniref:Integral membrane protein n=1 Tax=Heyndrickxia acidicola TaxID=209389 RepID=A0ABU6MIX3_9BACI|nr:VC0807 family protein [Heyndrickxia acidicola]MED1204616.1 hypothetical protein [Heyndrickxia acidicola]
MNKQIVLSDIICYLIFPLVIWHVCRSMLGDYPAMLVSSIPGILYTVYRFIAVRKMNIFGIFMVTDLVIGTLVDVTAGSGTQMLWNEAVYSIIMGVFFGFTIFINKPIVLYFCLDFTELQGHNRKKMKPLFYRKEILRIFNLITSLFILRELLGGILKMWLVSEYGADAFNKGIIEKQILNWGISALAVFGFIYISKKLNEQKPPPPALNKEEANKA